MSDGFANVEAFCPGMTGRERQAVAQYERQISQLRRTLAHSLCSGNLPRDLGDAAFTYLDEFHSALDELHGEVVLGGLSEKARSFVEEEVGDLAHAWIGVMFQLAAEHYPSAQQLPVFRGALILSDKTWQPDVLLSEPIFRKGSDPVPAD